MANEWHVQLPADDSNGKKLRTLYTNLGSGNVHMEVVVPTFGSGTIVDTTAALPVQIRPSASPALIGHAFISATSVSGGVCLTSAAVKSVTLKAQHFNSGEIYVGSVTTAYKPNSGVGYILRPDDEVDIDIDQAGKIYVYGAISGFCHVTYAGRV